METFHKLFGSLLGFVYHCFDRIVIQGYLPLLTRPEHIVHFFRDVHGVSPLTKDVLAKRTQEYQQWVEAFARNHRIAIEWADDKALKAKGLKREDYVRPFGTRMERRKRFGPYFILKSLEQGPKFGVHVPKYPTDDPNYRIVTRQRSRYTHYYFYIRDEVLGPMVMCVGSFLPFQTTLLSERPFLRRGRAPAPGRALPPRRQRVPQHRRSARAASGRRPAQSRDHSHTARLLDARARAEVLQEGPDRDQSAARLLLESSGVLSEFHLPSPLSDPQALRALV